jgi:hypothetical protein
MDLFSETKDDRWTFLLKLKQIKAYVLAETEAN